VGGEKGQTLESGKRVECDWKKSCNKSSEMRKGVPGGGKGPGRRELMFSLKPKTGKLDANIEK